MSQPIYITDPVVAAAYHVHPGEWAAIADKLEAAWLLANHHGYSLANPHPVPAPYYVHPDAPLPFVPYTEPGPGPGPAPAPRAAAPVATRAPSPVRRVMRPREESSNADDASE